MKLSLAAFFLALGLCSSFSDGRFTGEERRLKKKAKASSQTCDSPGDVNVAGCFYGSDYYTPPSGNSDHELEDLLCTGECAAHEFRPGLEYLCLGGSNEYMLISDLRDGDGGRRGLQAEGEDRLLGGGPSGVSYCCPNTCGMDVLNRDNCVGPFYFQPPPPFGKSKRRRGRRNLEEAEADGGGEASGWEERALGDGNEGFCNNQGDPLNTEFGYYEVAVGFNGYEVALYCCEAAEDNLPLPKQPKKYMGPI